ncbi:VWA domain-containing protein [Gordonia McavH-238-E]|uniref:vWA domain-containing protein n=1 Tax=Gordonia TaxID=2053 RepID=UPI001EF559E2|nr:MULTISPECIES: VWA domain-containing protein [Gordonia]MCG7630901.1 VWA domain-containing protein [Gordonia sp. McavH-238-E]UPW11577.1 VWA domain-containing protein [Gordonia terrae]
MKLSAALDVEVVAHEAADEVTVLLELQAPAGPLTNRTPTAFQVVLDRSGSMSGAPLDGARKALTGVVAQLDPADVFGVVTFDDAADVVVPAARLSNKQRATDAIAGISSGGSTDLSSGYLRALQEVRRGIGAASIRGGTVLIISDGHVNRGIQDVDDLASVTAKAAADGIVTSTLGYGRGYDETLLSAMAKAGNGNHVFADDPDAAGAAIGGEVDGLLAKAAQAVTLTVRSVPQVTQLTLYNDLPVHQIAEHELMIELGDLHSLEQRKLLLQMKVDGLAALGLVQVADLELRYVETATLTEHTVTVPISVNVVPGDELGDRIPNPKVHSEKLYQEGQAEKLRASRAFEHGDIEGGESALGVARARLTEAAAFCPPEDRQTIDDEVGALDGLAADIRTTGAGYVSKATRDSYHLANRKRGRRRE